MNRKRKRAKKKRTLTSTKKRGRYLIDLCQESDTSSSQQDTAAQTETTTDSAEKNESDPVVEFKKRFKTRKLRIFWQSVGSEAQIQTFFPVSSLDTIRGRVTSMFAQQEASGIATIIKSKMTWLRTLMAVFRDVDYALDLSEGSDAQVVDSIEGAYEVL
jgi:hypothetical protein